LIMRKSVIALLAVLGLACGTGEPDRVAEKLPTATSIPPHAWLVEQIGGDAVDVATMLAPGESPATHQPTDVQVSRVLSSRVYFRSGVPFESGPWFGALAQHVEVVDLNEGLADRIIEDHSHGDHTPKRPGSVSSGVDPHTWLSPTRLGVQAQRVAEALSLQDPDRASFYATNLARLESELAELDVWIRSTLAPYRGRVFIVFHPSWGYFAADYGLSQIAIEIDGKEPSDAEITHLQLEAREFGVSTIFVQPEIAGRAARAVADAVGAEVAILDPLAADVPANLRRTTEAIVRSFDE
jgi:zinc transport system substrate-binding protein